MNAEKLRRLQAQVRIGGKGTPRRKKKVMHQSAATDDKKLQSSLKKLSVSTIPGIEEVNIIKDDLTVIHFNNPKAQASLSANTFAVTGHGETKKIVEMLPEILPQLGQDTVMQLRMFANTMSGNQKQGNAGAKMLDNVAEEDEDVPLLVNDFEEVAKMDESKNDKSKLYDKKSEEMSKNNKNLISKEELNVKTIDATKDTAQKMDKKMKKQNNKQQQQQQSANGAAKIKSNTAKTENKQQKQKQEEKSNEQKKSQKNIETDDTVENKNNVTVNKVQPSEDKLETEKETKVSKQELPSKKEKFIVQDKSIESTEIKSPQKVEEVTKKQKANKEAGKQNESKVQPKLANKSLEQTENRPDNENAIVFHETQKVEAEKPKEVKQGLHKDRKPQDEIDKPKEAKELKPTDKKPEFAQIKEKGKNIEPKTLENKNEVQDKNVSFKSVETTPTNVKQEENTNIINTMILKADHSSFNKILETETGTKEEGKPANIEVKVPSIPSSITVEKQKLEMQAQSIVATTQNQEEVEQAPPSEKLIEKISQQSLSLLKANEESKELVVLDKEKKQTEEKTKLQLSGSQMPVQSQTTKEKTEKENETRISETLISKEQVNVPTAHPEKLTDSKEFPNLATEASDDTKKEDLKCTPTIQTKVSKPISQKNNTQTKTVPLGKTATPTKQTTPTKAASPQPKTATTPTKKTPPPTVTLQTTTKEANVSALVSAPESKATPDGETKPVTSSKPAQPKNNQQKLAKPNPTADNKKISAANPTQVSSVKTPPNPAAQQEQKKQVSPPKSTSSKQSLPTNAINTTQQQHPAKHPLSSKQPSPPKQFSSAQQPSSAKQTASTKVPPTQTIHEQQSPPALTTLQPRTQQTKASNPQPTAKKAIAHQPSPMQMKTSSEVSDPQANIATPKLTDQEVPCVSTPQPQNKPKTPQLETQQQKDIIQPLINLQNTNSPQAKVTSPQSEMEPKKTINPQSTLQQQQLQPKTSSSLPTTELQTNISQPAIQQQKATTAQPTSIKEKGAAKQITMQKQQPKTSTPKPVPHPNEAHKASTQPKINTQHTTPQQSPKPQKNNSSQPIRQTNDTTSQLVQSQQLPAQAVVQQDLIQAPIGPQVKSTASKEPEHK